MTKRQRYEQLAQLERDDTIQDEDLTEMVQLFYELYPESQYWRESSPDLTPQDIWGFDTSKYDEE